MLMHILSHTASSSTGYASASATHVDGGELLDSVQRMVDGNEQAYVSLSPHLYSCAGLAGAFVDTINDLETTRELATT
jgi:hypothetical protein